jgi:hypothetical protein
MPTQTWTLLDDTPGADRIAGCVLEAKTRGGETSPLKARWETLHSGLSQGVNLLVIENDKCSVSIIPQRGMGIWKALCGGQEFGWNSPIRGPVHPAFVPLMEPSGLGFLDGFDELLTRCGLESNGAPEFDVNGKLKYPLHGRIANKPAYRLKVTIDPDAGEISVTGMVEEARFHMQKLRMASTITMNLGDCGVHVVDEVSNFSASPAETQMLYHVNFGLPVLGAGAKLVAPVKKIVPRNAHAAKSIETWDQYPVPTPGTEESVYFFELFADAASRTQALLHSADASLGVSMSWDTETLPCFTLWKNPTAEADGYVTGLEPGTNFPNPRSFEGKHGRFVKLAPEQTVRYDLTLEFLLTKEQVTSADAQVAAIAAGRKPQIHSAPQPDWCS